MNKVVLSVAALAAISVPVQMQAAEEMTAEQKIAAKKAAINELRNELNAAMVYVEKNDPEVKEEYLKTLATINLALTKIYDDDEDLEISDLEINSFKASIQAAKNEADDAQAPYNALAELKDAYKTLKTAYDSALEEAGKTDLYPTVSAKKIEALKTLGVEALGKKINAYDPKENTVVEEKEDVLTEIKTASDAVDLLIKNIADDEVAAAGNESAHKAVVDAYTDAKAEYDKQLQRAIENLPTPIYQDWQEDAIAKLNEQYRLINVAKKADEALYDEEKSGTAKGQYKDEIGTAKAEILNIVDGYVDKKNLEETANASAISSIADLQSSLDGVKNKLYDRDLTDCDADINAVQKKIDDLKSELDGKYKSHSLNDYIYSAQKTEILSMISKIDDSAKDDKGNGYAAIVANYDAKVEMETAIAGVQKTLDDNVKTAEKDSDDKNYNAAARFTGDQKAIQDKINALTNGVENAYKVKKAVEYQKKFSTEEIEKANTKYAADTKKALESYNKAVKTATDAQTLLEALVEKTVDPNVTVDGTLTGATYQSKIDKITAEIKAINDKVAEANKKNDANHLADIVEAAALTISEDIKALTDSYDDYKIVFDKNTAVKAAEAALTEAQDRIDALQELLDGVTGDFGNQSEAITAKKTELQDKLSAVQKTKTDKENEFTKLKNNDKFSDEAKKEAAAEIISELLTITGELDKIDPDVKKLDADAQAAVANKKAYDNVTKAIEEAQATLDDVMENTVNPLVQTGAFQYYRTTMNGYNSDLTKVSGETDAAYEAITLVENEKDLKDRAVLINNNAKKFADAVLLNENTYTYQLADIEALKGTWSTVYNSVADNDLSNKATEYLQALAKQLEKINTLKNTTIYDAYSQGKSDAQKTSIEAERKAIEDEIKRIAKESQDNYDANVDATNEAAHNDFLETYKTANKAFSYAVDALNKFSNIKNGALQTAMEKLIATHDAIYGYADLLRKLKDDEFEDYKKYIVDETDGVDDIYSAKKWNDIANGYRAAINKQITDYQDEVNQVAKTQFETTISQAKTTVKSYKNRISNYICSEKETAFKDVEDVIAEAKAAGAIDSDGTIHDKFYAVNVDTWFETLSTNIYTMLQNDIAAVSEAEYKKLRDDVMKVYDAEKKAIENFEEIDNAKYLKQLEDLKTLTIDYVDKYDHTSDHAIENYVRPFIGQGISSQDNYFGKDANVKNSDIYQEAFDLSAGNKANLEAYDRINTALALVESDFNDVVNTINTLVVAHQASDVFNEINRLTGVLKSQREEIENWKMTGACVANEEDFYSFLSPKNRAGFPQNIEALKDLTISGEVKAIKAILDEVKEEYNQAAAADLDKVKEYDAKIQGVSDAVDAILTKYEESREGMFEGACGALLAQEAVTAQINSELNAMYENSQIADAKEAIDTKLSNIDNNLKQAEEWADYNDATRALAQAKVVALRGEYELINADYEAKVEAGQILIYKDALLFDLDNVANAVPGGGSELYTEYNKQLTNDNVYSQLKTQLDTYSTSLDEAYERINVFTHRKQSMGQDIINSTYNNLQNSIKSYGEQLETAHTNVTLSYWGDLNYRINGLSSSIYNMEKDACIYEADGALDDINASVSASLEIKNESLYGGNRAAELQKAANEIGDLVGLAKKFNTDAQDNSIAYDIDGNDVRIKYDWSEYLYEIRIDYLYDDYNGPSAWSILSERIAKLQADAEQLAADVVDLAYIEGDADNDKRVTVNDYSEVRNWILAGTAFDEVSEAKRYGGDVNGDEEFTVADMTGISNIIFYGNPLGEEGAAKARVRSAVVGDDAISLSKESEETSIFGKTVRIAVSVDHSAAFTAGQFDVTLPAGMSLAGQSLSDRSNGHELMANEIGNGTYRFVAATIDNNEFSGRSGALVFLDVEVSGSYAGGDITVGNIIFSDARGTSYRIVGPGNDGGATGVDGITAPTIKERIYSIGGQMKKAVVKGLNILVGEDGKAKKVIK